MDITQESALQYAQRHGLFHSQRHDAFSPQSCLTGIKGLLDDPAFMLHPDESLVNEMELPHTVLDIDQELLEEGVQEKLPTTTQTKSPFSYQSGTLQDLLLELPAMRPDSAIHTEAFFRVIGIAPINCLATQYLPLISVDPKRDQGLDFPPHADRLHQALLYKVNNERIMAPKNLRVLYQDEVDTKGDVFSICETAITPPPSPTLTDTLSASDSDTNIFTDEPCLRNAELPSDVAKQQVSIKVFDRNSTDQHVLQQEQGATYPETISEKETANPVVNAQVRGTDQVKRTSPLEIDVDMTASGSFFEDALFVSSEYYQDEDVEMESIASILDQIDNLLMPLPNVPPSDLSYITSKKPNLLSALGWEHHKHLTPLPLDPALEEALPWAPLPPRRRGQFESESLAKPCEHTAQQEQDSQIYIGSIGNINDGEIEERPEPEEAFKPRPPPTNALDSLIKLRLQRSASEHAPQSRANISSMQSQNIEPILPNVDDPGATSRLVSAFMSLRGVKAPRSNRK